MLSSIPRGCHFHPKVRGFGFQVCLSQRAKVMGLTSPYLLSLSVPVERSEALGLNAYLKPRSEVLGPHGLFQPNGQRFRNCNAGFVQRSEVIGGSMFI